MFWGLTIEPGKHYTQTVEESFHVSMVALDTRDVATSEREQGKLTQLMIQHEKAEFLVCTLCYGTFQQSLDLNFTEGEEVTFFTEGRGTLHLTGYLVKDEPMTLDPDMMSLEEMSSSDDVASDSGDEMDEDDLVAVRIVKAENDEVVDENEEFEQIEEQFQKSTAQTLWGVRMLKEWASGEESSLESPVKSRTPRQWLLIARQKKGHQRNTRSDSRPRKVAFVLQKKLLRRGNSHKWHSWKKKRKLSTIGANSYGNNFVSDEDDQRSRGRRSASTSRAHGLQEQRAILQTSDNVTATLILSETPSTVPTSVTTLPTSQPTKPDRQQPPDNNVLSLLPTQQQETQISLSTLEAACPDLGHVLPTQVNNASTNAVKGALKRKQPKSKIGVGGSPKRLLGSSIALTHRKIYQRKVPTNSGGQIRQANRQWNVSLPPAATLTNAGVQYSRPVFPDMVEEHMAREMTDPLFDGATSQDLKDNHDQHPLKSEDGIQPDRLGNTGQYPVSQTETLSHSQPMSAEAQPGCSTHQPQESYPPVSPHSLVPTSLAMAAAGPTMDTSPSVSVQASAMNNVYWSCMPDQPGEVGLTGPGSFAVNAGGSIHVASDMDFLTAEDMTFNGVNIGNQKLRLAHGYDVFISRFDLWEAERASKRGWTILTRRLLDIYFDRMTLAMGKPTHHGNSTDYQPLDQHIIGAIRAFIKARYNIEKRWASGEESPFENQVKVQRLKYSVRARKKHRCSRNHLAKRQRNIFPASHRHHQQWNGNSHVATVVGKKKRNLGRQKKNCHMCNPDKTYLGKRENCMSNHLFGSSPKMGLQLHVQNKHVVLNTSENLSLIWNQTCEENRPDSQLVSSNETTNHSHQQKTLSPLTISRNSAVQQVEGTDVLSKRNGYLESDEVQILNDTASQKVQQAMSFPLSHVNIVPNEVIGNIFIEDSTRMASTNPQSPRAASPRNAQEGRCTSAASVPSISEKRVVSPSTADPQGRHQSSSEEQGDCLTSGALGAPNDGHKTETISCHLATSVKKMPLKPRMIARRHPKRLSRGQRRRGQKNSRLTFRDGMKGPSPQWNASSSPLAGPSIAHVELPYSQPLISNVVGGQKAVEMTRMEVDRTSWQSENATETCHQRDRYPQTGDRGHAIGISDQDQAGLSTGSSYPQQATAEHQPGCSMESPKSYHQQHNNDLVPTSLTIATGPSGDTPMSTAEGLPLVIKQDMDSVFWTCLSEETAGMDQRTVEEIQADENVPVASDLAPFTADLMTYSGVANKRIRLAHGYDVFIRQSDLFEAERSSKESWSILTRRLLDIYFDRMTLAMGRASYRGTNEDHKPLDQAVIGAIGDATQSGSFSATYLVTMASAVLIRPNIIVDSSIVSMSKRPMNEDEMTEMAVDDDEDDEDEVPSLQELAAASLEDEDDDFEDDEWKPKQKKPKRKLKQMKKDAKRQHLEEPDPEPRKAKQLANLELSKNQGDSSDSDENSDDDFNPMDGALQEKYEDLESDSDDDLLELEEEENLSDEDGVDSDDSEDNDELYDEEDSDYLQDSQSEDVAVVRSLRNKQDTKERMKSGGDIMESPRILRAREIQSPKVSPAKSSGKVTTAENKENVARQLRLPKEHSTPKTEKPKGNETSRKTPRGNTGGDHIMDISPAKGQAANSNSPSGEMVIRRTPRRKTSDGNTGQKPQGKTPQGKTPQGKLPQGKTPQGKTPQGKTPQGKTPQGKTPQGKTPQGKTPQGRTTPAKTPTVGRGGQADQEGKSSKQDVGEKQTPTSLKKDKKKDQQSTKTPKKVKLTGGTVIEDLVTGDGKVAKAGKMVHVYYSGTLAGSGKQFDSCLEGKPFMFRLGRSEVIKGWDMGISGMKIGGKRRITVPAAEGYGRKVVGPIPSNSTLVFNVTLKNVS